MNSLFRNKLKVLMVVISCYFLSVSIIHAADESQDKSNNNEEKVLDETTIHAVDEVGAMVAKEVEKTPRKLKSLFSKINWQGRLMFPLMKEVPSLLFLIPFCFQQENLV